MVGVHVGDEDRGDLLPSQVEPAYGDLRAFPAIEEEELPLSPEEDAREGTLGKGHHAAATKDKSFQVHRARLYPIAAALGNGMTNGYAVGHADGYADGPCSSGLLHAKVWLWIALQASAFPTP
jgi:hypothetical protein